VPRPAREQKYQGYYGYQRPYPQIVTPVRPKLQPVKKKKVLRKKKINPFKQLISLIFLALIGLYVIPYGYDRISRPLLFGPVYPEIQVDFNDLMTPTADYLSNDIVLNTRLLEYP